MKPYVKRGSRVWTGTVHPGCCVSSGHLSVAVHDGTGVFREALSGMFDQQYR